VLRIDLPPLSHVQLANGTPPHWIRTLVVIAGVEHVFDLLGVRTDAAGVQRAATPELDEMLALHHLAVGGDGPFATIEVEGVAYVLFLTPTCA
jgi:hypothetical protein